MRASGDIANEVDGAIGEGFSFYELHGYYRIQC